MQGWKTRAKSAIARELITSSLVRGITAVRRRGDFFFFVISSIGRMIHAPSRTTSSECLHFLLVRMPLLLLHPGLSFPWRSYAALAFRHSSFFFFFCSTNSILAAILCADALSIFPDFCRHRVAFAYRFRCTDTPESIRSPPFNITRLPRRFCSSRPDESLHVIRITDEERVVVSISSAQLYVLRPEVENYHRNTKTATVV